MKKKLIFFGGGGHFNSILEIVSNQKNIFPLAIMEKFKSKNKIQNINVYTDLSEINKKFRTKDIETIVLSFPNSVISRISNT